MKKYLVMMLVLVLTFTLTGCEDDSAMSAKPVIYLYPEEKTEVFLEDSLAKLGLTEKEANEFIIYWLPKMEGNAYNLISFQGDRYTENAKLEITPTPDSVLRVFMAWKAIEEPVEIEPQTLQEFERKGFTVVEWGGTEVMQN